MADAEDSQRTFRRRPSVADAPSTAVEYTAVESMSVIEQSADLQGELSAMVKDGFLSDVTLVSREDVAHPKAIAAWESHPYKLYSSPTATRVIRKMLDGSVPGILETYDKVLSTITQEAAGEKGPYGGNFCYLVGGQVRDILRGQLAHDFDFNVRQLVIPVLPTRRQAECLPIVRSMHAQPRMLPWFAFSMSGLSSTSASGPVRSPTMC